MPANWSGLNMPWPRRASKAAVGFFGQWPLVQRLQPLERGPLLSRMAESMSWKFWKSAFDPSGPGPGMILVPVAGHREGLSPARIMPPMEPPVPSSMKGVLAVESSCHPGAGDRPVKMDVDVVSGVRRKSKCTRSSVSPFGQACRA